jgi:predicted nucleic acid-binding protein
MILVDTSVIVALLDTTHKHHRECSQAIVEWAGRDELAVSAVTYAELAAGGRTQEAVQEDLRHFVRLDLDFSAAWRAGQIFRRSHRERTETPVLPDFFIRAQAAVLGCRHLTNDRRRLANWPDVDFVFPD